MIFSLKNPWYSSLPNLNKKISANQTFSDENIGTEFLNIKDFINALGNGSISFDNFTLSGTSLKTSLKTTTASYSVVLTDEVILADSTNNVVTITLPTSVGIPGQRFTVKDWKGQSATNNITIATTSSQTIDGATTKVVNNNYASYTVASDGANWAII